MIIWKLTIRPDNKRGFDPFELCRTKSLVGVGWSGIFEGRTIVSKQDCYDVFIESDQGVPPAITVLFEKVKEGDFIWLQKSGEFFLCKVKDSDIVFGPQIADNFTDFDLGHARNAAWVRVSALLVPGSVQRGIIARRMIQRIDCSPVQEKYFQYIHSQLSMDPHFSPRTDDAAFAKQLASISPDRLNEILGPPDYEDLAAAFLQTHGWTLLHSTYFRGKPEFEFTLVRPGPKYAHVQVKCGNIQLRPTDYERYTSDTESVILLSTANEPYPGEPVARVETVDAKEVLEWAQRNPWALLPGVKLQVSLCELR